MVYVCAVPVVVIAQLSVTVNVYGLVLLAMLIALGIVLSAFLQFRLIGDIKIDFCDLSTYELWNKYASDVKESLKK